MIKFVGEPRNNYTETMSLRLVECLCKPNTDRKLQSFQWKWQVWWLLRGNVEWKLCHPCHNLIKCRLWLFFFGGGGLEAWCHLILLVTANFLEAWLGRQLLKPNFVEQSLDCGEIIQGNAQRLWTRRMCPQNYTFLFLMQIHFSVSLVGVKIGPR